MRNRTRKGRIAPPQGTRHERIDMGKKKKPKMEYRYYRIPPGSPALALLGEEWTQHYGRSPDYLHFHNHLEIGYCYYGKGLMTFQEDNLPFQGDMFTVIPKNFPHTTNSSRDTLSSWEYLFIDVDGFLSERYYNAPHMADRLVRRINRSAHLVRVGEHQETAALIRQLIEVMRSQKELYQEEAAGLVWSILIRIARWNHDVEDDREFPRQQSSLAISRALNYIGVVPERPIKIEELASMCHMSETHFRRIFVECMKTTPVEYINQVRIQRACDELKRTNDPVSAIASRTGFSTLSTFNRNFRRIMGVSPQQWRKKPEFYEHSLLDYAIQPLEGWGKIPPPRIFRPLKPLNFRKMRRFPAPNALFPDILFSLPYPLCPSSRAGKAVTRETLDKSFLLLICVHPFLSYLSKSIFKWLIMRVICLNIATNEFMP